MSLILQSAPHTHELEAAKSWLEQKLSGNRLSHSFGTSDKAVELATKFGLSHENIHRCALAGLLHDCAKLMNPQELETYAANTGVSLSKDDEQSPQTIHAKVAAQMVRLELGYRDEQILNAIASHTTGRAGMSEVEKIVYIADKIEGNTRNPLFIKRVAENLRFKDPNGLDKAMLYLLESSMSFVMEKGQIIHPLTLEARNDLVIQLKHAAESVLQENFKNRKQ